MGIRFQCHHCHNRLHVKDFQAGRRSRCPECRSPFRIPLVSQAFSDPAEKRTLAGTMKGQQLTSRLRSAQRELPENHEGPRSRWQALDSPGVKWMVKPPSGGEYGPADSQLIRQWIREERVSRESLVRQTDWSDWLRADSVFTGAFPQDSVEHRSSEEIQDTNPQSNPRKRNWMSEDVKNKVAAKQRARSRRQLMLTCVLAAFAFFLIVVLYWILTVKRSNRVRANLEAAVSRHNIDWISTTEWECLLK